jgi:hypothetical protein
VKHVRTGGWPALDFLSRWADRWLSEANKGECREPGFQKKSVKQKCKAGPSWAPFAEANSLVRVRLPEPRANGEATPDDRIPLCYLRLFAD